jgi:hypothetical protein
MSTILEALLLVGNLQGLGLGRAGSLVGLLNPLVRLLFALSVTDTGARDLAEGRASPLCRDKPTVRARQTVGEPKGEPSGKQDP